MKLVLPIYNSKGLGVVLESLAHRLPPHVTFMLVSGNMDKPLDLAWVERSAETLKARFPSSALLAATAGLGHIQSLTAQVSAPLEGVVYIYEPNFSNEPEFTWGFADTLHHFAAVRELTHAKNLHAICKPTGRPLYQNYLFKHGWDYALLGAEVDELFVQTQTYCKKDPAVFAGALGRLIAQRQKAEQRTPVSVQISLDPASRNGVTAHAGEACLRCVGEHLTKGELDGLLLWWSPRYPEEVAACLEKLTAGEGWSA